MLNQITRATVSISSNIAEDSIRTTEKDSNRFLEVSLGSSFGLETQLLVAEVVQSENAQTSSQMLRDIEEEQKKLISFMSKVNK